MAAPPPQKKEGGETKIIVMQLGKPAVENLSPFSDPKNACLVLIKYLTTTKNSTPLNKVCVSTRYE